MAKYNFEYKVTVKNDSGIATQYVKKVIDESALTTELTTIAAYAGIDFLTLRRVAEVKPRVVGAQIKIKEIK